MKRFVIRYGLIGGCILIALGLFNWFFIARPLGYQASEFFGYLSMVVALLCIPLGIMYFRNKLNNGSVSFNQAFKIGLGITAITSVVMFFHSMLFFIIAGDDFLEWSKTGLTATELEERQAQLDALPDFVMSPWFQGVLMALTVFLIGVIISLVSSFILKQSDAEAVDS